MQECYLKQTYSEFCGVERLFFMLDMIKNVKKGGVLMGLSKRQMEAAKMIAEGHLTQREIAQKLNVTEVTISRWKHQEEFQKAIEDFTAEMKKDIERKLMSMSSKALRELDRLLSARSEMVRLQAIKDVLDRLDIKPADKQDIDLKTDMEIVVKLPEDIAGEEK